MHAQGRYQGVEWRDQSTWLCNNGMNPYQYVLEDSRPLAPMELMFVKVKDSFLKAGCDFARTAVAYDEWLNATAAVRSSALA